MNKIIQSYILENYGFDVRTGTPQDFQKVSEILVRDRTMSHDDGEWDFSDFPNLKKIDCSYNPIDKLVISANHKLEEICFQGARGNIPHPLDFSGNPLLKKVSAGQDGVKEFDFSSNPNLEKLSIFLSSDVRWLNIDVCSKLKSIDMQGANIPFVDLTHCNNLEWLNISYWNLYKNQCDEFGPGFPRPFIFVNEDFDENIIDGETRRYSYYTYFLIRVKPGTAEEHFLAKAKSLREVCLAIPSDRYGRGVAAMHYELLDIYNNFK